MRILELTNFSGGGCGVWARCREESIRLKKLGHDVKIFSSNIEKGSNKILQNKDEFEGVEITRFPAIRLGGESFMYWNFRKEALDFKPDLIIAHNYRQLCTTQALRIKKKICCRVFLVTHAPFNRSATRSNLAKFAVWAYDSFLGKGTLKKFDKVLAISNWEIPFLSKIDAESNKIELLPNGIREKFFTQRRQSKNGKKIIYLGRIAEIKNLESLIKAMVLLKNKEYALEIFGPAEEKYLKRLKDLAESKKVEKRTNFSIQSYKIDEQIYKLDESLVFVLPSKSEGMPQSLIEAMARGLIVIGSDSLAIRDIIKDKENGFLFEFDNPKDLAKKIDFALSMPKKDRTKISENAKDSVKKYSWDKIIKKLNKLIESK